MNVRVKFDGHYTDSSVMDFVKHIERETECFVGIPSTGEVIIRDADFGTTQELVDNIISSAVEDDLYVDKIILEEF